MIPLIFGIFFISSCIIIYLLQQPGEVKKAYLAQYSSVLEDSPIIILCTVTTTNMAMKRMLTLLLSALTRNFYTNQMLIAIDRNTTTKMIIDLSWF